MKQVSKKEQLAIEKGIHRDTMIEMGMYNVHIERVYADKKKYKRKEKFRKTFWDND